MWEISYVHLVINSYKKALLVSAAQCLDQNWAKVEKASRTSVSHGTKPEPQNTSWGQVTMRSGMWSAVSGGRPGLLNVGMHGLGKPLTVLG